MAQITISVTGDNAEEILKSMAELLHPKITLEVGGTLTEVDEVGPHAEEETQSPSPVPKAKNQKRKAKPKPPKTQPEVEPDEEEQHEVEIEEQLETEPLKVDLKQLKSDAIAMLVSLYSRNDAATLAIKELLPKYGVKKFADVPEDRAEELLADAVAIEGTKG